MYISLPLLIILLVLLIIFAIALVFCIRKLSKIDAIMHVDKSDPERDQYGLVILCPMDDISKKNVMIVKVQNDA